MIPFSHIETWATGPLTHMQGISDIVLLSDGGTLLQVYTTSGPEGGLLAWSLSGGTASLIDRVDYAPSGGMPVPMDLKLVSSGGQDRLIAYGQFASGLIGAAIESGGTMAVPGAVAVGPGAILDLETLELGENRVYYTTSRDVAGIGVWVESAQGAITQTAQIAVDGVAPGAETGMNLVDLGIAQTGGVTYLLALSAVTNGVTGFRVGADGGLTKIASLGAPDGLAISTPTVLETVTVAGQAYALVGAAGSSSISVIRIGADGSLHPVDQVMDSLGTRFDGLSVMKTVTSGDRVFVIAGGADDGLSLMALLPGGRLLHLGSVADDTAMALTNPGALGVAASATGIDIVVSGEPDAALTHLHVDLGPLAATMFAAAGGQTLTGGSAGDLLVGGAGNDVLDGGTGDDILIDGAGEDTLYGRSGKDIFVFTADGRTDWVMDFNPRVDRLDLSALGRFYDKSALTFTPTADGTILGIGQEQIHLVSALGKTILADDIPLENLVDLSHSPILTSSQSTLDPGETMTGAAGADTLTGTARGDLIDGGDGADTLDGGDGDDTLIGGAGTDSLFGGTGDDLLQGGVDADMLSGAAGNDTLQGDDGADRLFGGAGNDSLSGGADNDVLSGDGGDDALDGGAGADALYGGAGSDLLDGGDGDDTLWGGTAGDLLRGGAGNDLLLGEGKNASYDTVAAQVFRLYQATLDRAPDAAGHASFTHAILSGEQSLNDAVLGLVNSAEFQSRYGATTSTGFVTLLYDNVLGRAPDAAGLAGWTGHLDAGDMTRSEVVLGFSESREFQTRTAASALSFSMTGQQMQWSDDVFRLYQATLDRAPDEAGFTGWTTSLAQGTSFLTAVSGFVGSTEFQSRYGSSSDGEFVTLLYGNVLHRAPDAAGLSGWTSLLETGAKSRAEVVQAFAQSREFIGNSAQDLKDWMHGQNMGDTLDGGPGDDILFGGLGADTFRFTAGDTGTDTVIGLEHWDFLEFSSFGYTTAGDVLTHLTQAGNSVVFADQGVTVHFEQALLADVTADMILV